jgi:acetylornithine deacetylase/succinyl-diaminopimelate desuccinylase-like protein
MADTRSKAIQFAHDNRSRFLDELGQLVAIPSISAESSHKPDILRAAEWLMAKLRSLGFENIQLLETGGSPMVFAESMHAGAKAPVMLAYGHYDVQPVDPLNLWDSPPFEGTRKDDLYFGRGASDMKGQVIATMAAIESAMSAGKLPINIKFIIEGEEETGSPNMPAFIRSHKELLASDFSLNTDAGMLSPEKPTITYGLRGLAYFEVHVTGPKMDLHSGYYGGTVRNPANELARLIGGMHDKRHRVTLPGFYDKVRPLDKKERADFARLGQNDKFYREQTGAKKLWGEDGYTPVERVTARPTLDVNGFLSGYVGEGPKTVLPATAMAKISCRLVPNQTPKDVEKQLKQYMRENADPSVTWDVKLISTGMPSISERDSREVRAMAKAQETVWGVKPIFRREGGSVPVVGDLQTTLKVESVNVGFGLPEDRIHSPNERMHVPTWEKGIDALVHFIYNLGEK